MDPTDIKSDSDNDGGDGGDNDGANDTDDDDDDSVDDEDDVAADDTATVTMTTSLDDTNDHQPPTGLCLFSVMFVSE